MSKKLLLLSAAAAITTAGALSLLSDEANADNSDKEKCYGIAKASKNDCGANGHSCAGHAAKDGDANEWIFVPKGLCDKLAGASTEAGHGEDHEGDSHD